MVSPRFLALAVCLVACGQTPEPIATPPSQVAASASASAAAAAASAPPADDVRLPKGVTPKDYTLDLRVDPRKETFEGAVTVRVALDKPSRHVVLHARDVTVTRAVAAAGAERLPAKWSSRRAKGAHNADEELVLSFERDLPAGEVTIEIVYSAPFAKLRGLYRVKVGAEWYAFTQLEAVDARRMFPSFDEPRFKTPFSIRVSAPQGMKAFANSAMVRTEPDGDQVRHIFEKTLPLPTYLVAIAVGNLDVYEGPKSPVPVRLLATSGKAKMGTEAVKAAADFLKILGEYFDRPYPYGKLDLVAVPDFGPGAMENVGLVTFREELLLVDGDAASMPMKRRMASVTAHELAHQWFGNLVTMPWWDDLWLNEGFATWMAAKACDTWQPGFGGVLELTAGKLGAMNADMLPSARPVRVPVETSDAIHDSGGWSAYQKGGSVIAMLERWIGEAAFRDGIRAYVKAHEHGTVTSEDLLLALDKATDKPVSKVAKSFLDQPGVPLVTFEGKCTPPPGSALGGLPGVVLRLSQAPLDALPSDRKGPAPTWTIPVCVGSGSNPPVCTLLDGGSAELAVPGCGPVYPNASEAGYYRFAGADIVALTAMKSLTEAERLGLLSNAWALTQAGRLDAGKLFDVLDRSSIGAETSRVVVDQAIGILYGVRDALIDAQHAAAFRGRVSRWLTPQAKRLGWDAKRGESDDVRLLRLSVLGALWDLAEDAQVARDAEPRAAAYLKDPKSVDRDLGPLAVRISALAGGAAKPDVLKQKLATALPFDRTVIISALASVKDAAAQRATFEMLVSGDIRAGDARYVWGAASRRPESRAAFSAWLRERFVALQTKLDNVGYFASTIGWQCDEARQSEEVAFFEPKLSSVEGMQRSFDEGLARSRLCVRMRSRELANAGRWLDTHK
jgi:alanyl aminopeptidase